MNQRLGKSRLILSTCLIALALAGCGGGGGGARPDPIAAPPPAPPPPPPPPAPPPPPPPPPPVTATNYNDAEYGRSNGATAHNAIAAYDAGATGRGIKIGIVDSGINPSLPDFAGKIDPASQDVAGNRGITDTEGHGTAVSAVAAAARNGSQNLGVAFDATIISLNTSNASDCSEDDGCKHNSVDIARGIDLARVNGARVINVSLGGEDSSNIVNAAVARAAAAGIIVVMSAGNEGEEATGGNPEGFALSAAQAGNVIIAGAINAGRQMTAYSNKAGSGADHFLAALGDRIRTFDHEGTPLLYSGTSFAAPVISGAVALLASAFPNLSGAQIIQILYAAADDAGAVGVDPLFGRGILNIARAFQPQGRTSLAGSGAPVPEGGSGTPAGPMGDAVFAAPELSGAVILDGFSRAFVIDLAHAVSRAAAPDAPLAQSLAGNLRSATSARGMVAVSITMNRRPGGQAAVGLAQLGLAYEDAREAKILSGLVISRLSRRTALAMGLSESGKLLQQRLAGHEHDAFLVARDPGARLGFHADSAASIGIRHDLGVAGITFTAERGEVHDGNFRGTIGRPSYTIGSVAIDQRIGPVTFSLGAARLDERASVLGGSFASLLGTSGASSWFADGSAGLRLGNGWSAHASYRRGWTSMAAGGALAERGRLTTSAWSLDVARRNVFQAADRIKLRLMQPLRVSSGGYDLNMPVSYDYSNGQVGYQPRFLNLAPEGREIDLEVAYATRFGDGSLSLNAFLRHEAGHIKGMRDDPGGAIRYTLGF